MNNIETSIIRILKDIYDTNRRPDQLDLLTRVETRLERIIKLEQIRAKAQVAPKPCLPLDKLIGMGYN